MYIYVIYTHNHFPYIQRIQGHVRRATHQFCKMRACTYSYTQNIRIHILLYTYIYINVIFTLFYLVFIQSIQGHGRRGNKQICIMRACIYPYTRYIHIHILSVMYIYIFVISTHTHLVCIQGIQSHARRGSYQPPYCCWLLVARHLQTLHWPPQSTYVCICRYICIWYMFIHCVIRIYMFVYVHICMHTHIYIKHHFQTLHWPPQSTFMCICRYICIWYMGMYITICIYMFVYMHICIHTHMYQTSIPDAALTTTKYIYVYM